MLLAERDHDDRSAGSKQQLLTSSPSPTYYYSHNQAGRRRQAGRQAESSGKAMRFGAYALLSVAASVASVMHAFHTREQFYPVVVFLTTSKLQVIVLANLAFLCTLLVGRVAKRLFLGRLTNHEVDEVVYTAKGAVIEAIFAFVSFRQELTLRTCALFGALFFFKVFHWLAMLRVEHAGRVDDLSLLTHVRLAALLLVLMVVDALAVATIVVTNRLAPTVLLLFGFEYAIMLVTMVFVTFKYGVLLFDGHTHGQRIDKPTWLFVLDFAADLIRLFLYVIFFALICIFFGLPLYLIRELYVTLYNLRFKLSKFYAYRKVTRNMNERFPDATPEDLRDGDDVCIICRETMQTAKKLPCAHMFHFHCLRSWIGLGTASVPQCPTCRTVIPLDAPVARHGHQHHHHGHQPHQQQQQQQHAAGRAREAEQDRQGQAHEQEQARQAVGIAAANVHHRVHEMLRDHLGGFRLVEQAVAVPPSVGGSVPQDRLLELIVAQTQLVKDHMDSLDAQRAQLAQLYESLLEQQEALHAAAEEEKEEEAKEEEKEEKEEENDDDEDEDIVPSGAPQMESLWSGLGASSGDDDDDEDQQENEDQEREWHGSPGGSSDGNSPPGTPLARDTVRQRRAEKFSQ